MSLSYSSRASRFSVLLPTGERRDSSYHWLSLARETTRAAAHCTLCCGDILTFLLLLGQWLQALFHLKILPQISKLHEGIVLLTVKSILFWDRVATCNSQRNINLIISSRNCCTCILSLSCRNFTVFCILTIYYTSSDCLSLLF